MSRRVPSVPLRNNEMLRGRHGGRCGVVVTLNRATPASALGGMSTSQTNNHVVFKRAFVGGVGTGKQHTPRAGQSKTHRRTKKIKVVNGQTGINTSQSVVTNQNQRQHGMNKSSPAQQGPETRRQTGVVIIHTCYGSVL